MRTKFSKRLLSFILSALMIVTSVPAFSISAQADTDVESLLEAQMQRLETIMDAGTTAYNSTLKSAYIEWYQSLTFLMGHKVGLKTDAQVTAQTNDMKDAVDALAVFNSPGGSASTHWSAESTFNADNYANLLYADASYNTDSNNRGYQKPGKWEYTMYYPQAVMLYDGVTTPQSAIMLLLKGTDNSGRVLHAVYSNNLLTLPGGWHGSTNTGGATTMDFAWNYAQTADLISNSSGGSSGFILTKAGKNWIGAGTYDKYTRAVSNVLQFGGDESSFDSSGYLEITPSFRFNAGSMETNGTINGVDTSISANGSGDTPFYVVNYAKLYNAMKFDADITLYSYPSMTSKLDAIIAAQAVDPSAPFQSMSGTLLQAVQSAASSINTAKSGIDSATLSSTGIDFNSYRTLSSSLSDYQDLRSGNNGDGRYTAVSYQDFADAYDAAMTHITNVVNGSVYATDCSSYASDLATAYAGLVTVINYVDDSDLQEYFSLYKVLNPAKYTSATWTTFQTAINDAKTIYVDNNPNSGITLIAGNATDEATYASKLSAVQTAYAGLVKDPNSTVVEAYETTGTVSVDPVLYVHGSYGGDADSEYAYMMTGGRQKYISDGTVTGEYSTRVTLPSGKTLSSIEVYDDSNHLITDTTVSVSGGKLVGSLDSNNLTTLSYVAGGTALNRYVTIKFVFSDGVYEQHRLAIKQNPVAQHAVAYAESWNGAGGSYVRMVGFEALAYGSYGTATAYSATYTGDDNKFPASVSDYSNINVFANYPKMYAPSSDYGMEDGAVINGLTKNSLAVDKSIGAYASVNEGTANGHSTAEVEVTTPTATYYLDKSDTSNLDQYDMTYTSGTSTATLKMMVAAMHDNKHKSNEPTQPIKNVTCNVTGSNLNFSSDDVVTSENGMVANSNNIGYTTIRAKSLSVGTRTGVYSVKYKYDRSDGGVDNGPQLVTAAINIPFQLIVMDKSELRTRYNELSALGIDSRCYTTATWNAYISALVAAEQYLNNYQSNEVQATLLSNLNDAYDGLAINTSATADHDFTDNVVAPTCTTGGYTEHTCSRCGYYYTNLATNPLEHDYVYTSNNDNATHTITCSRAGQAGCGYTATVDNCVDSNNDGACDLCGQSLMAVWTTYNANKAALIAQLTNYSYSVSTINNLVSQITAASLQYVDKTDSWKNSQTASIQSNINDEATTLATLKSYLESNTMNVSDTPSATVDTSAADAVNAKYDELGKVDPDMYDQSYRNLTLTYSQDFTVLGESITAYSKTQAELDAEIQAALEGIEALTAASYDIYLNGTKITTAQYGSPFVMNADGTYTANAADLDASKSGIDAVGWSYSYASPSNGQVKSTNKFLITAPSVGFIVKGTTYLTTDAASNPTNFVTIKASFPTGEKTVSINPVEDGKFTMPALSYSGYNFTGFSNGASAGQVIDVTENMTITATFTAKTVPTYTISYYDGKEAWNSGESSQTSLWGNSFKYNERVDLASPTSRDIYAWAKVEYTSNDTNEYTVVSYSDTYSFYVCEDLGNAENNVDSVDDFGIVSLTQDEYEEIVADGVTDMMFDGQGNKITQQLSHGSLIYPDLVPSVSVLDGAIPITNNDTVSKISLIGTFICPDGYTLVECGMLFTKNTSVNDITVDKAGTSGIARMKASKYTVGNQFVINVKNSSGSTGTANFKYVGYATFKNDSTGILTTVYSKTITDSVTF